MSSALQHSLFVSRLAPGLDAASVPSILEVSRLRNPGLGITGVLVFDGEHFAQWLEGPPAQVLALAARIEADRRHVEMRLLHTGIRAAAERLAEDWRAGYADAGELAHLHPVEGASDAALALFLAAIPRFDLSR